VALPAGTTVTAIAAGGDHSLALTAQASSASALTAAPVQARRGAPVALTASVTCTAGAAAGTVTFQDGRPPWAPSP
jgi:hypothetical protein